MIDYLYVQIQKVAKIKHHSTLLCIDGYAFVTFSSSYALDIITCAVCDVDIYIHVYTTCTRCVGVYMYMYMHDVVRVPQFDPVVEKALDADETDGGGYSREALPTEADFILAYATVPG